MSKTILVIDDDRLIRDLIEAILNNNNYRIIKAESGVIGCNLAKEYIPDLIICDLMMPEVNGFDVLKFIRRNPNTKHIPLIILSIIEELETEQLLIELGANDYVIKNYGLNDLPQIVLKYL